MEVVEQALTPPPEATRGLAPAAEVLDLCVRRAPSPPAPPAPHGAYLLQRQLLAPPPPPFLLRPTPLRAQPAPQPQPPAQSPARAQHLPHALELHRPSSPQSIFPPSPPLAALPAGPQQTMPMAMGSPPAMQPMVPASGGQVLQSGSVCYDNSMAPNLPLATQVLGATAGAGARGAKPTRPFKAYPKDPLSLATGLQTPDAAEATQAYAEFRRLIMEQTKAAAAGACGRRPSAGGGGGGGGGAGGAGGGRRPVSPQQQPSSSDAAAGAETAGATATQPAETRAHSPSTTGAGVQAGGQSAAKERDAAYYERRRRNNEAAKRSRDARRAKEDEIAIRAAFLERENYRLRLELEVVKAKAKAEAAAAAAAARLLPEGYGGALGMAAYGVRECGDAGGGEGGAGAGPGPAVHAPHHYHALGGAHRAACWPSS